MTPHRGRTCELFPARTAGAVVVTLAVTVTSVFAVQTTISSWLGNEFAALATAALLLTIAMRLLDVHRHIIRVDAQHESAGNSFEGPDRESGTDRRNGS